MTAIHTSLHKMAHSVESSVFGQPYRLRLRSCDPFQDDGKCFRSSYGSHRRPGVVQHCASVAGGQFERGTLRGAQRRTPRRGDPLTKFRGREAVIVVLNALMGLPPVVVGLSVFLL